MHSNGTLPFDARCGYALSTHVASATSSKALFTRNLCVNVNIKFNIVFMMTEMQTQRIGWTHFLRLRRYWHSAKLDANIDFDALFTKPPDCVPPAGTLFRGRTSIHSQWTFFSILHGTTSSYGAGGFVNSAVNHQSLSHCNIYPKIAPLFDCKCNRNKTHSFSGQE